MVALQAEKKTYRVTARGSGAVLNFGLSILAAVLQIATTVAVVQAMPPSVAGIAASRIIQAVQTGGKLLRDNLAGRVFDDPG